ncbi:MAG: ComF family protein [Bacteroidetes bacterium]|nr:ComF family protein [Bacteroidota bacterium]
MLSDLFSLLFPNNCASCGNSLLKNEHILCLLCNSNLPFTGFAKEANNSIEKIFWGRTDVLYAMSLLYFDKASKVQTLMHKLKYDGEKEIGFYFGKKIAEEIEAGKRFEKIDLVLPVPLHPKKLKARGYNQSKFISDGVAHQYNINSPENLLIRTNFTESQTKKSRWQRWDNVQDKFSITNASILENKHVLLVDDVITTGATIEACVKELSKVNTCKISVASVAFASSI